MNRPFVNGNREQTNNFTVDGFDVNETIDNRVAYQPSPDALAEISVETNNYAADVGNVGGAVISNVIKSGANQVNGNVFEFYRNSDFDANTWENNRSGAPRQERKQHIYGAHPRRPHREGQAVLLRGLPGLAQDAPGSGTASVAPRPGGGEISPASPWPSAIPHRAAVSREPDPARPHQPDGARDPERHRQLPAAEPDRERSHRQLRRRDAADDPCAPGRPAARLERLDQRQAVRALLVRDPTPTSATRTRSRCRSRRSTTSRSTTSASTGARSSAPTLINEVLVGYSKTTVVADTFDWAGIGDANARYGIAGGQDRSRA
jgi:hypothetical protein